MEKTYGNRVPAAYRWAMSSLVTVSLIFLVAAAFGGLVSPLSAAVLTIIGLAFVVIYWRAGTMIAADSDSVRVQLPPLWRKNIQFKDIRTIEVETIKPIEREWGNRGSLKKGGEIFVDAGHSKTCLAFYLIDSNVIRLGVSSPQRGRKILEALESCRKRQM